jgi:threonine/homoserine/homoserine lactone efflux protein
METTFLPDAPLLTTFVIASLVLAIVPGPGVLYIVARSLVQGRRSGLTSVAGVALGNLGNAIGASLGLAALFAVSSLAFTVIKYAGAAYLVYLGIQALRAPAGERPAEAPRAVPLRRTFATDSSSRCSTRRPRCSSRHSCHSSWTRPDRPWRRVWRSGRCS